MTTHYERNRTKVLRKKREKYHSKKPDAKFICKKAEDYNTYLSGVSDIEAHKHRKKLRKARLKLEHDLQHYDKSLKNLNKEVKKAEKLIKKKS